jgi:hypothetical protein
MHKSHLALVVALNVAAVWTIVVIVGLITHDYAALTYVTPLMLAVAGYLFGDSLLKRRIAEDEDNA